MTAPASSDDPDKPVPESGSTNRIDPQHKIDPQTLSLRAAPRGVTRLNRRMLIAVVGGLSIVVLGATFWSLQPRQHERNAGAELVNVERVARSEHLEQLPKDYASLPPTLAPGVPVLGEPLPGDLGPAIVNAHRRAAAESRGSAGMNAGSSVGDGSRYGSPGATDRLASLRDGEEAAKSGVFFTGGAAKVSSATATPSGSEPLEPASSNQSFNPMVPTSTSTPASATTAAGIPAMQLAVPASGQNRQDQKTVFVNGAADAGSRNPSSLQLPVSPYQVMAGTIIPAALVTGINSDLPGQVIASVTESVYDTATGRYLLIPQGSRLLGRYDSQVSFGQRRVLLVWTRLILPDTSSIALDRLPGIDPAGYAGLEDGVDWHWDRILSGAALSTLLGVGAELAAPDRGGNDSKVVISTRQSVQDTVNQVGQELTKRNLNIQPTLSIRPGFPMRVMVNKDLVLRPYQPLFFVRGASQ